MTHGRDHRPPFAFAVHALGPARPPLLLLVQLAAILVGYVAATEVAKKLFYSRVRSSRDR